MGHFFWTRRAVLAALAALLLWADPPAARAGADQGEALYVQSFDCPECARGPRATPFGFGGRFARPEPFGFRRPYPFPRGGGFGFEFDFDRERERERYLRLLWERRSARGGYWPY
jgi:hypothetical protein